MTSRFLREILVQPKLPSANIPKHVKDAAIGKLSENSELKFLWQYRKGSIRRRYATFGSESGLNPGICWPSKEELAFMKEYEKKFEKSFNEMRIATLEKERLAKKKRKDRENQIRANLSKVDEQKKKFWEDYHKLYQDIEKEKDRKEKVIQDVREFLGYDIGTNDPRFEEALLKKDEEEKALLKAQRKLDRQKHAMDLLQSLVNEALEKEKKTEGSSLNKNSAKTSSHDKEETLKE